MTEQLDFLTETEATQFVYVIARFDGVMAQRFGTSVVVEGADNSTIQRALDVVGRAGGFEPLEDLDPVEPRVTVPEGRPFSPSRSLVAAGGLMVGFLFIHPIVLIPMMLVVLVSVSYRWWRDDA